MLIFQMVTYRLDQASTRVRLGERVGSWSPVEGGAALSTASIGPQPSRPMRSIGLTVALSTNFGQAKLMSVFHPKRTLADHKDRHADLISPLLSHCGHSTELTLWNTKMRA